MEVALMAPWIFLLFIAVFDFGFYAYALISTENAARVGALYASSSSAAAGDGTGVCLQVLPEMRMLPNVGGSTTCSCSGLGCTAGPIQTNTSPMVGASCLEGAVASQCVRVTVQYQTIQLFPLPGLAGRLTMLRIAEASVKSE